MTKLEELIVQAQSDPDYQNEDGSISTFGLKCMIKEYAEFYAQRCLEIAAKEASANFECVGAVLGAENVNPYVEPGSILNIKLPEHI